MSPVAVLLLVLHVVSLWSLALILLALPASAQTAQARPGVPPADSWTCPATHPIKGNFTPSSGERCIYHVPGGGFYGKTKPERCYATDDEAARDGCRRSKR
jgi:hypothetical protein